MRPAEQRRASRGPPDQICVLKKMDDAGRVSLPTDRQIAELPGLQVEDGSHLTPQANGEEVAVWAPVQT